MIALSEFTFRFLIEATRNMNYGLQLNKKAHSLVLLGSSPVHVNKYCSHCTNQKSFYTPKPYTGKKGQTQKNLMPPNTPYLGPNTPYLDSSDLPRGALFFLTRGRPTTSHTNNTDPNSCLEYFLPIWRSFEPHFQK